MASEPDHSNEQPARPEHRPADLAIGAFSDDPPWLVEPANLIWRAGIDELRTSTRAEAPVLTRRHMLPPGVRVLRVCAFLGRAFAGWYALDRRRGAPASRAGLSRRLRRAFERLGPTYIKLGQVLSSGEGIFPEELVAEFRLCRDQVPAESFSLVRKIVEEDLRKPLHELFTSFDPVPVAAASIAQVHVARLTSGEEVAVKVQRPQVSQLVKRDLAVMSWIAPVLVGRIPAAALGNPPALVDLFAETIVEELDFRLEAQNMLDVARVLMETDQHALVVPRPHPRFVTRRVLVMERLEGYAWGDVKTMRAAGIDTEAVISSALIAFLEGAILFGVFHGDLHGGNLFVRPDGRVALLDFGITGRLDEPSRLAFLRLIMAGAANDTTGQVAAMRDLGALPANVDVNAVVHDLGLDRPLVDPTTLSSEELTSQIRNITKALFGYGARMPKELMLFVKDMLFLDGAMATMAPSIDVLGELVKILAHLQVHHGQRIARELGLVPGDIPAVDVGAIRASFALSEDVERLTHSELIERRELIRRRIEHAQRRKRRQP